MTKYYVDQVSDSYEYEYFQLPDSIQQDRTQYEQSYESYKTGSAYPQHYTKKSHCMILGADHLIVCIAPSNEYEWDYDYYVHFRLPMGSDYPTLRDLIF